MHCDWLNVTVPEGDADRVSGTLLNLVTSIGGLAVCEGLYRLSDKSTFKYENKRGFSLFSASGGVLSALRSNGLFPTYLNAVGEVPHRVTRLDVAHDVYDRSTIKEIRRLSRKSKSPGIALSRKKLKVNQVTKILRPDRFGNETGTINFGHRARNEVTARVYDKANERFERVGEEMPPCTRYELTVTDKAGASLKDAYSPEAVFWHFMSEILSPPSDAPQWIKGASGFNLGPKVSLLPSEALRRLVERSPQLLQMFELADDIGPHGYDRLLRLINAQHDAYLRSTDQPAQLRVNDSRLDPANDAGTTSGD